MVKMVDAIAERHEGLVVLLGRLAIGVLFLPSGFNKLSAPAGFAGYLAKSGMPGPLVAWAVLAGLIEFFAALAIVIGFKTRTAALLLCFSPSSRPSSAIPIGPPTTRRACRNTSISGRTSPSPAGCSSCSPAAPARSASTGAQRQRDAARRRRWRRQRLRSNRGSRTVRTSLRASARPPTPPPPA